MKPLGYPFHGIDVSHHQPPSRIRPEHAPHFVIPRATYGILPDETFLAHVAKSRAKNVPVTGYHFFRQTQDPDAQFEAFSTQLGRGGIGAGDLIPVLDLESNKRWDDPIQPELYGPRAKVVARRIERAYGECHIYCGGWFYQLLKGHGDWILNYSIHAAHYRGSKNYLGPSMPPKSRWHAWQYEGRNNNYQPEAYPGGKALDVNVAKSLPVIKPAPVRLAKAFAKWFGANPEWAPSASHSPPEDYEVVADSPRAGR